MLFILVLERVAALVVGLGAVTNTALGLTLSYLLQVTFAIFALFLVLKLRSFNLL